MRLLPLLAFIAITLPAHADFSYTVTSKNGGAMAAMAPAPTVNHYFYKGQKMKFETASVTVIMDMDARTVTTLNAASKTYTVRNMDEALKSAGATPDVKIDVKETGQKKMVNGYMASEIVMTMEMDSPPGRQGMGPMQMEMDMWISPDVPGVNEMRDFHKRNADKFPWSAMAAGANPSMAKAIAELQHRMAQLNGVPVQQIMRVKSAGMPGMAGGAQMPQMTPAQQQQMQAAMAKLEALKAQGGPAAAAAQQAMGRMGGMSGMAGGGGGASSGALIEITMDGSDFSGGSVPESVFAIPADYQKAN
jgi:hypothetical protein